MLRQCQPECHQIRKWNKGDIAQKVHWKEIILEILDERKCSAIVAYESKIKHETYIKIEIHDHVIYYDIKNSG